MVDALLLTLVVDTHVAKDSQGELTDHFVVLWGQIVDGVLS